MRTFLSAAKRLSLIGLFFVILLVFFEGLSSCIIVAKNFREEWSEPIPERFHTQYDSELGWSNIPKVKIPNIYGAGKSITINSQGFRSEEDLGIDVLKGKSRIICSGASLVLGVGVDDKETWCHLLSELNPRYETVNAGQGGYGLDQVFLWYKRDVARYPHQIHIVGITISDLVRMELSSMRGYHKPTLEFADGDLVAKNVPVPERSYWFPRILTNLKSVQLLSGEHRERKPPINSNIKFLAVKVLENIRASNESTKSKLMVVLLPRGKDLVNSEDYEELQNLGEELRSKHFLVVDLLKDFSKLSEVETKQTFYTKESSYLPVFQGHYTSEGHKTVAKLLLKYLAGVK